MLYFIYAYGVNLVYWDDWDLVPLLDKLFSHNLHFSDLWAQHNEHRIVFPRILMLTMAYFTGWDIRYELYMSVVIVGITFLLLCSLLKKTFAGQSPVWLPIIFSFIVFSPAQWQNWTWGWQIQIFMSVLGTVAAIWAVAVWPGQLKGLIIGTAAALFASLSFANGTSTWVIAGLVVLLQRKWKWGHVILWAIVSVVVICLYYYKYTKPAKHPPLSICLERPFDFAMYILAYIGSPLTFGGGHFATITAILTGGVLVLMMCAAVAHIGWMDRKSFVMVVPWAALAVYVFLSAGGTAVGRLGFGISQATRSRYVTIAGLFVISLLVVLSLWVRAYGATAKHFAKGLVTVRYLLFLWLVSACALSFARGKDKMRETAYDFRGRREHLMYYQCVSDDYLEKFLYPKADVLRERAQILSKWGLFFPKPQAAVGELRRDDVPSGELTTGDTNSADQNQLGIKDSKLKH